MGSKGETRARVGLFGIGLEAYWSQFDGLKERLEGYRRHVEEQLGRWAQVVWPEEWYFVRRLANNVADREELESYAEHIKLFGSYGLCFKKPHCTDLLNSPAEVLADRARWPSHLCYEDLLRVSTERWAKTCLCTQMSASGGRVE